MPRPKLDANQLAPDIAPLAPAALCDLVPEFGLTARRLCAGLGFTPEDLRAGVLLSDRQIWRLIRRALQLTGRTDLGLELGRRNNLGDFGLPGFAMAAARTLSDALELGIRYQRQAGGMVDAAFERTGPRSAIVLTPRLRDPTVLPFLVEEFFSSVMALLRILLGGNPLPWAIELAYAAPPHAARYHELFACPVKFGEARNRMVFPSEWLSRPLAAHSPVTAAEMRAVLDARAHRDGGAGSAAVAAVEQVLNRAAGRSPSIEDVARTLGVSVRTLRRRLEEAGCSFRELIDRVRARGAQQMLGERGVTVAQVGARLGFSDVRAFRRAYKRWVGRAPGTLRSIRR
ncbi:MAG: AraC family transcriptional regulator [Proteobacteria bacterium]|nr:AraC family transcriptional regulator [Pseudomonadota bacterium]